MSEGAFSKDEQEAVDFVVSRLRDWTGAQLSELTHSEAPWRSAREGLAPNERSHRPIAVDCMSPITGRGRLVIRCLHERRLDLENQGLGKAGEALTSPLSSSEDRAAALAVVNYWREIHAEVLQRALEDIEGLIAVDSEVLVAGRIKKLSTIVDKLGRADAPFDLQTMYDIAGAG